MGNQPHVHSVDEAKANISRIEHNAAGQGPGPSGKRGGPPTGVEGGSGANETAADHKMPKHKGGDWITEHGSE
jgi:hypothetical protein